MVFLVVLKSKRQAECLNSFAADFDMAGSKTPIRRRQTENSKQPTRGGQAGGYAGSLRAQWPDGRIDSNGW